MDREEILKIMGNEIRRIISYVFYPVSEYNGTFDRLKELASYTDELLQDSIIRKRYENQLRNTEKDENTIKLKLDTFAMIRNVLIHFPYYKEWEDVFITPEMLTWNKKKSTIKKYFDDNKGKEIKYNIYIRDYDNTWKLEHELNIIIPELKTGQKVFLKDFMSIKDAFWTFCLIDSLLEYLNIDVLTFSHYSI